nr:hypothetical protein [Tanacetum cinerariifolium]
GPSGTSGSPGAFRSSQVPPPPPPPPSTNQEGQSHGSTAPSSSKTAALAEYKAWITTDIRLRLSVSSTPEDLQMDDDMAPDAQVHSSDDEDIGNAHIPKVNLQQDWLSVSSIPKDLHMDDDMAPDAQVYSSDDEDIRNAHIPKVNLRKGGKPVLSISQMKTAYYPDVGLEQIVPDQMWIEEECKYDIAAIAVRTHMRILSVVRIEVFSMYGSPEPSTTQRQEYSHYCNQLMDQTLAYQTTRRRLPAGD